MSLYVLRFANIAEVRLCFSTRANVCVVIENISTIELMFEEHKVQELMFHNISINIGHLEF
jgi:hypothetical protein